MVFLFVFIYVTVQQEKAVLDKFLHSGEKLGHIIGGFRPLHNCPCTTLPVTHMFAAQDCTRDCQLMGGRKVQLLQAWQGYKSE